MILRRLAVLITTSRELAQVGESEREAARERKSDALRNHCRREV